MSKHFFDAFWQQAGEWSNETFGPPYIRGPLGPLDHLSKEIEEVKKDPTNITEYVDLFFLVIDAIRRAGFQPLTFEQECWQKLAKNKSRKWPDWRTTDPNKAIEHIRICSKQYWIGAMINNCKLEENHKGECQ